MNQRPTFPEDNWKLKPKTLFASHLPEKGMGDQRSRRLGGCDRVSRGLRGPRFFGYVLGSGEPIGAAADLLASVLNQNVTAWRSSPSAVTIERVVVGWLAEAIGCAGFTGSLTGGGSSANLMGLAMAREARMPANESGARPGTIYASRASPHVDSQSHRIAGYRTASICDSSRATTTFAFASICCARAWNATSGMD